MGYIYDTTVIDWDREEQYNNKKRIERILNDTEDDEFKISKTIIKNLKSYREKKPETPYHPDQFFTQWGILSRG